MNDYMAMQILASSLIDGMFDTLPDDVKEALEHAIFALDEKVKEYMGV